jgi:hypothetical protein
MADLSLAVIAGSTSTVLFMASVLPMVAKALRTRDLTSYSLGNLLLANAGNAVHSLYVFSLPVGPIWALHTFYAVTSALMLVWFLQYGLRRKTHASWHGNGHLSRRGAAPGTPSVGATRQAGGSS